MQELIVHGYTYFKGHLVLKTPNFGFRFMHGLLDLGGLPHNPMPQSQTKKA